MKVLIWLVCIFVFSLVQTIAHSQGVVLGGVPTVLLALVLVFLPAPLLCKLWDKRTKRLAIPKDRRAERWYTCPKCGQLVQEGEACDCEAIRQVKENKLCGTTFIWEKQRLDAELAAGNITQEEYDKKVAAIGVSVEEKAEIVTATEPHQKKRRTTVALSVLCIALAVCTCVLGYCATDLAAEREKLATENEILNATLHDLSDENARLEAQVDSLQASSAPSFSAWARARAAAQNDWETLYDAGDTTLLFDEWWVFVKETYLAEVNK